MRKRSIFACLVVAFSLSACATVSVVPGSTTVETSISKEQSALREASSSFNETAVTRGWISEGRGVLDIARVLVEGASQDDADKIPSYADLIGVGVRGEAGIKNTILTDVNDATAAMSDVSDVAKILLDSAPNADAIRTDLVSFERVLIQAQQSRRSFMDAITAGNLAFTNDIEQAIAALDNQIDRARSLADTLAAKYARRDTNRAVS